MINSSPGYFILVLKIDEAFACDDKEFEDKYRFLEPNKTASNVILTCKSGVRALKASKALKSIGCESFR